MTETPDTLRAALAGNAKTTAGVQRSDTETWNAAHARMQVVQDRLAELHPKALMDDAMAEEYLKLIEEAGRLNMVLAGG